MLLLTEYLAQLDERINRELDSLGHGAAADYPAYQRRVGTINGLRMAGTILRELVNQKPREERDI